MKISNIHKLLTTSTDSEVLESLLGPNWRTVINFWLYLDKFTLDDYKWFCNKPCIGTYFSDYYDDAVNRFKIRQSIVDVVPFEKGCWSARGKILMATLELIYTHKILEQKGQLIYVRLFDGL
jgi:hypothetical protein